jgi:hypothetical protein
MVLESALIGNYTGPAPDLPQSAFAAYFRDLLFYLVEGAGIAPYQAKAPQEALITPVAKAELHGICLTRLKMPDMPTPKSKVPSWSRFPARIT